MRPYATPLAVIAAALIISGTLALVLRREIVVTPWGYWDVDRLADTLIACELLTQPTERNRRVSALMYPPSPSPSADAAAELDKFFAELKKGKSKPEPLPPPAMPFSAAVEKAGSYVECAY
jgi:hypothetical protein